MGNTNPNPLSLDLLSHEMYQVYSMLAKIYNISSLSPLAKHMGEDMTWPLQSISVWDVCSVFPILAVNSIMHMVVFFNCLLSPLRFLFENMFFFNVLIQLDER